LLRAASSRFKVPVALTLCVSMGFAMDRDTLGNAAT
jgi:hypothetical protein